MYYEFQALSNGCEECIFEWASTRSICWATNGISRSKFSGPCSTIEESIIWVEASTKSMVWSFYIISFGSWFQKRSSRLNTFRQTRWEISLCSSSVCGWHCVWFINWCSYLRIFRRNEEGIQNEHGGGAKLLPWSSSETTKRWDIHISREVSQKSRVEIWFRLQETCIYSNEYLGQTKLWSSQCKSRSNSL